ncbi:hypothetical protein AB8S57_24210 [Klebsiella pneumoniae]|uniref:hypothetical protein n=1 Tax=Klebsiella pneumoniae TaxID=573 RepID=UPI003857B97A
MREILISESAWEEMTCLFAPSLKNGARITISSKSPSKDLIIYGLEKAIRGNHDRARMTFIDFMYYWHERIFKQIKRKSRPNN